MAPFIAAGVTMLFDIRSKLLFLGILAAAGTYQLVHGLYRIALPKRTRVGEDSWLSFLPRRAQPIASRFSEIVGASFQVLVGFIFIAVVATEL